MTDTASPARPRRRGEYAKTHATRQAILDAALEVFAESGYRAGSLREIAVRVGMSEAGLLHHFRNKVALLEAVLSHRDEGSRRLVPIDTGDGADVLRGLVRQAEHNASTPGVVELYCTLSAEATSPDHPAHAYFVRRYAFMRGILERAFIGLQEQGMLRIGFDPQRMAVTVIALMDGLQVQWLLDRRVVDMAEALRELFDAVVDVDWTVPVPEDMPV